MSEIGQDMPMGLFETAKIHIIEQITIQDKAVGLELSRKNAFQ